jgi:hypothetical protein
MACTEGFFLDIFPSGVKGIRWCFLWEDPAGESAMTTRNWLGGGNNSASDPQNWSPSGAPEAGDTLNLNASANMNIAGDALRGDTLTLNGDFGATPGGFDLTVYGLSQFSIVEPSYPAGQGPSTVDIGRYSAWVGGFSVGATGGDVTVKGEGAFYNTTTNLDNDSVIDTSVYGAGTFTLLPGHHPAKLEFAHYVSPGQGVAINGYAQYPGSPFGAVQVDDPQHFHASITMGFGELVLEAIKADSYSIRNNLLTLYDNGSVTDKVHIALATDQGGNGPQDFGVTATSSGVVIHADGSNGVGHAWASGTVLGLAQV